MRHYLAFFWIYVITGLLCFRTSEGAAQDLTTIAGAPAAAMANTMVADTNIWAAANNPAGLAWCSKGGLAIAYRNAFSIENLGNRSLVAALPFGKSAFGLNIQSFGDRDYLSTKIGLSYGLKLGEKTSIGAQLQFSSLNLGEFYGQTYFLAFGLGARYAATKKLTFGAYVFNPTESVIAKYQSERSSAFLAAGMSYSWSAKLRMTAEAQQRSSKTGGLRVGLEYLPIPSFVLRGGGGTGPALYSFGFGWRVKNFDIDVATHYHNVLGFSPQVALSWVRRKK